MKYSASLLAVILATAVSAGDLGRDFTVNLLTQVPDFSVSFPQLPDQVPVHYNNATIKHVYGDDNVLYSVVGSLTFTETDKVQAYHLDSDQWTVDIECSVQSPGGLKHLDLTISRSETDGGFLRFDGVSANLDGVNVISNPVNKVDKEAN